MFIIHLNNGETLIEGQNDINWDKVPGGISSLELGTFAGELLTLPQCKEYFYSVEAVSTMPLFSAGLPENVNTPPVITAKIIGGILNNDMAILIRVDTRGHIKIELVDKKDLPFVKFVYKKGI